MEPTPSPLSPTSYLASPNPVRISPNSELFWNSSWDDVPTATHFSPTATHFSPPPVYSWEDSESMSVLPETADLDWDSLVVPDTPDYMLDLLETGAVFTSVPETQLDELDFVAPVVPEPLATIRRGKRPVQESKELLLILLPEMKDLL